MTVIPILLLCSLGLVGAAVALFWYSVRQGDCERSDRLCLLPLEEDDAAPATDREQEKARFLPDPGESVAGLRGFNGHGAPDRDLDRESGQDATPPDPRR